MPASPTVVAFAPRERTRTLLRAQFPRRRGKLTIARSASDVETQLRTVLTDAVVVDVGGATEETWRVGALARDYPSTPFFAIGPLRSAEAAALAQCALLEFSDLLVDSVDEGVLRELVARDGFSQRLADALAAPPAALALASPLQQATWRAVVAEGGRPVRTATLATQLRVSRRAFAAEGAPNLKRVIDLVRVIAAAELAKNPGLDLRDVARILEFASASHLSTTAQRIAGTKPASLARLRAVDLVERFAKGHTRSRG